MQEIADGISMSRGALAALIFAPSHSALPSSLRRFCTPSHASRFSHNYIFHCARHRERPQRKKPGFGGAPHGEREPIKCLDPSHLARKNGPRVCLAYLHIKTLPCPARDSLSQGQSKACDQGSRHRTKDGFRPLTSILINHRPAPAQTSGQEATQHHQHRLARYHAVSHRRETLLHCSARPGCLPNPQCYSRESNNRTNLVLYVAITGGNKALIRTVPVSIYSRNSSRLGVVSSMHSPLSSSLSGRALTPFPMTGPSSSPLDPCFLSATGYGGPRGIPPCVVIGQLAPELHPSPNPRHHPLAPGPMYM